MELTRCDAALQLIEACTRTALITIGSGQQQLGRHQLEVKSRRSGTLETTEAFAHDIGGTCELRGAEER